MFSHAYLQWRAKLEHCHIAVCLFLGSLSFRHAMHADIRKQTSTVMKAWDKCPSSHQDCKVVSIDVDTLKHDCWTFDISLEWSVGPNAGTLYKSAHHTTSALNCALLPYRVYITFPRNSKGHYQRCSSSLILLLLLLLLSFYHYNSKGIIIVIIIGIMHLQQKLDFLP